MPFGSLLTDAEASGGTAALSPVEAGDGEGPGVFGGDTAGCTLPTTAAEIGVPNTASLVGAEAPPAAEAEGEAEGEGGVFDPSLPLASGQRVGSLVLRTLPSGGLVSFNGESPPSNSSVLVDAGSWGDVPGVSLLEKSAGSLRVTLVPPAVAFDYSVVRYLVQYSSVVLDHVTGALFDDGAQVPDLAQLWPVPGSYPNASSDFLPVLEEAGVGTDSPVTVHPLSEYPGDNGTLLVLMDPAAIDVSEVTVVLPRLVSGRPYAVRAACNNGDRGVGPWVGSTPSQATPVSPTIGRVFAVSGTLSTLGGEVRGAVVFLSILLCGLRAQLSTCNFQCLGDPQQQQQQPHQEQQEIAATPTMAGDVAFGCSGHGELCLCVLGLPATDHHHTRVASWHNVRHHHRALFQPQVPIRCSRLQSGAGPDPSGMRFRARRRVGLPVCDHSRRGAQCALRSEHDPVLQCPCYCQAFWSRGFWRMDGGWPACNHPRPLVRPSWLVALPNRSGSVPSDPVACRVRADQLYFGGGQSSAPPAKSTAALSCASGPRVFAQLSFPSPLQRSYDPPPPSHSFLSLPLRSRFSSGRHSRTPSSSA